jgi:rod shape-determining protein MreC
VVTARLVSSTGSSGRRFALLDAGRWQGVTPGMPVLGPDGLIGRVVETGPAVARVLLLSDAASVVPVRRTRDGLPAIAAGRGDGSLDIRSVTTNVRFQSGDVFVTTGTGGLYAPGTPVARVVRAGTDSALADSFAHPDGLDFALVTRPFMPLPPARP